MNCGDRLNRVVTSVPLNSTAARVTSRGTHYEPRMEAATWFSEQPPLVPLPVNQPQFENLTGRNFGCMTVIGYGGTYKKAGSRWICRCVCGRYEYRRGQAIHKAILSGSLPQWCQVCDNTDRTRKGMPSRMVNEHPEVQR